LVDDFSNEASGAQRQYAALASKADRTRKGEIAVGLLDAEWAATGGSDSPSADPRWLAGQRARFEYRFETEQHRSSAFGVTRSVLLAFLGDVLVAVVAVLIVAFA
jgi:hypothetical protein